MKTVVVNNQKGGVGKTTLAAHIGWYLAENGRARVLMIDTDAQGNLSSMIQDGEVLGDAGSLFTEDITPSSAKPGLGIYAVLDKQRLRSGAETGRRNGSTTISVIFSIPPGTDPDRMKDAVRSLARTLFEGKHDYAMALHTDGKHPHVHLTLRTTGQNGLRLNPRKADLAEWRELFAERLRSRGIVAEATPRRARGVVRKAERTPVRKARERYEQGRGAMPRVRAMAYRQQAREMAGFDKQASRAWEQKIVVRQRTIRSTYLEGAAALARSTDVSDQRLAQDVRHFVASMPPLALQRHVIGKEIAQKFDSFNREKDALQARSSSPRENDEEKGIADSGGGTDPTIPQIPDRGRSR